jgi:nuclear GTP-binding protein
LILRSAIKVEELNDPIRPIDAIVMRIDRQELLNLYQINDFKTTEEFLGQVARKKGLL